MRQQHPLACALALVLTATALTACGPSDVSGGRSRVRDQAIVGGATTTIAQRPFQISLQTSDGFHFCGGSIIAADWVLTAQHCMEGSSPSDMRIIAGVTHLSDSGGQVRSVNQVVRNPGFSSPENGHDVTLLHLSSPLALGGNVRAVALATPEDASAGATDPGVDAIVSGWGALSASSQNTPDTLMQVTVPIVSLATAEQAYGGLTDDQLPAGAGGHDSCQGDSGGPLTVEANGGTVLAGVVSWGSGCGDEGFPGLYARVSSFTSWIQGVMSGTDVPPPTDGAWMCDPSWVGDGQCDCGCGSPDSDCPDNSLGSCEYNDCDSWQPTQGLELDSSDPSQCVGGVGPGEGEGEGDNNPCPAHASLTADGTACQCDSGYEPDASLTSCVVAGEGEGEAGEGEGEASEGEGEGDGNATAQRRDDEPNADDTGDGGGCASTSAASPLAALALALVGVRRRRAILRPAR